MSGPAEPAAIGITGSPALLERWNAWRGGIDCGHLDQHFDADALRALANDVSSELVEEGLLPGEPVAMLLANTAAFPVVLVALLQCGCNPILIHAASPAPTVQRIAREFGARFVLHDFVEGVSTYERVDAVREITVGPMQVSMIALNRDRAIAARIPGEGVVLHATSGTYGAARFCIRNQDAAVAEALNYTSRINVYRTARVTVTTPLSHAYAYGFGLASALVTDSVLAVDAIFNPKRILRLEREQPSTILALVPPMVRTLTALGGSDPERRMPGAVFYAGAALDAQAAGAFENTFGVPVFAILGTTETGAISTTWSDAERLAGVGRPFGGVSVSIANSERFRDIAEDAGELVVQSSSMMQGYVPGDIGQPIDAFPTGDIASLDADGSIHLIGRIRDIINLGGMKVDPAEVEAVLLSHPDVTDAAVYPGLRDNGSEFVQAAVAGVQASPDALHAYCVGELEAHKVPMRFHLVGAIPRTPSGKCLKVQCPDYPVALLGNVPGP